jgi:hypothetical protein
VPVSGSPPKERFAYRIRMSNDPGNLAIAEPPVRVAPPLREVRPDREPVTASELALLRERIRRMRMPRGESLPRLHR